MEAILKFTLPEEKYQFECAINGIELASFQDRVFEEIRNRLKYKNLGYDADKELENLRDVLLDEAVSLPEQFIN